MVYNYGSLAAFQSPSAGYVSSCSPQILHGTYDWGDFPSVFLWGADELRVLELHVGLPASVEDIGLCGIADPFDGLKLDAWPLRALSAK
jgi:hypothetical protein